MIRNSKLRTAAAFTAFALLLAVPASAQTATPPQPIFPMAAVVGLVPPQGMVASKSFPGFEDVDEKAVILVAAQPTTVYDDLKKTLDPESLKKQGIIVDKQEEIPLSFGTGTLVTGTAEVDKTTFRKWLVVAQSPHATVLVNAQIPEQSKSYTDQAVRAALATLAVRDSVPDSEKLALLPFTINDLAGFHVQNVLPGRAALLGDTPGASTSDLKPHMFIAVFPGGPTEPDQRAEFARVAFGQIAGIEEAHVTISESLRIGNQPGYQTVAQAKEAKTGAEIMVAQWLRFTGGGFMQMIATAPLSDWPDAQTRLRTVRDSIDLK